jgi:hypothetical protein
VFCIHGVYFQKQAVMDRNEIVNNVQLSIWLDTYDDIFSDFDPRPFKERALSDDFINEARKMAKEKPEGEVELKLLLPHELRDADTEQIIIRRLHRHFSQVAALTNVEMNRVKKQGIYQCGIGFLIMIATTYLYLHILSDKIFYLDALRVILEPAGWFFAWTGFENIFVNARHRKPEFLFNEKMAQSEITFLAL